MFKVLLVLLVLRAFKVPQVLVVQQAALDLKVLKVTKVFKVLLVLLVLKAFKALQVLQDQQVPQDLKVFKVVRDLQVLQDQQVPQDLRVYKVLRVDYQHTLFLLVVSYYGLVQLMLFHLVGYYVMVEITLQI